MENIEFWKDVIGYEGLYQVSDLGNVKSLSRFVICRNGYKRKLNERVLKPNINCKGYYYVILCDKGNNKTHFIHKLVSISFLNHIPCGYDLVVNHKDFNRLNNNKNNLEIITQRENTNRKHFKSTSKYVGVYFEKSRNKYMASICINKKQINLGRFNTELEAHEAYQNKLKSIL